MKKILHWGIIGGLFAVPFIPFIVSSSMLFPFISGKGFVFRILIEVLTALYVLYALYESEYRPKLSLISKSILVFIGVVLIADIFGQYAFKSIWSNYERMEGFVTIAHLGLYYFVLSGMVHTEVWWKHFWNTSLCASALMAFYGFLQLGGQIAINQGGVRLDATFGNASYLAIYIVFHMFLATIFFIQEKNKWIKGVYGLLFILQGIVLYNTATRGAILGFIGGMFVSGLLIAWKEKHNRHVRTIAKGILGIMVVLVIAFFSFRNTETVQKSPVLSRFATLSTSEIQTQGRYYVWPMAVKGFLQKPLLGWGQENFNYVFNAQYNPAMYGQEQWFDRTHNVVLDWLIAGGAIGFLAYAGMFYALLYFLWKKSNMSVEEKSLITGFVVAYIFHNMFVFDNLISYIYFFALLAYVHGRTVHQGMFAKLFSREFSKDTLHYIAAPLIGLVLIVCLYVVNVPAINASRYLIKAISPQQNSPQANLDFFKKVFAEKSFGSSEALEQLVSATSQITNSQVADEIKTSFYDFTNEQIKQKIAQTPEDARYLLFGGSFYNRFGKFDQSVPLIEKAIQYSPKKPAMYFELGNSFLAQGDYQKAFEQFQIGYTLEPRYVEGQIVYAVGALYAGKNDIAAQMLQKLDPVILATDNRIVQAYVYKKDYQSVLTLLQARVALNPKDPQNRLTLAGFYAQIGQKKQAIDIIQSLINEYPEFKTQGTTYIQDLSK
jgi:O-antigen ligase/tetratricopeptide (TPR) repeat protein